MYLYIYPWGAMLHQAVSRCTTLQHMATHGNTWQHMATHGNTQCHAPPAIITLNDLSQIPKKQGDEEMRSCSANQVGIQSWWQYLQLVLVTICECIYIYILYTYKYKYNDILAVGPGTFVFVDRDTCRQYIYICMHTYEHMYIYTCECIQSNIYICIHIWMHTHIFTYIYICI